MLLDDQRFRVERSLGKGGFGVVYEAFDLQRHARVALKLLRRTRSRQPVPAQARVPRARRSLASQSRHAPRARRRSGALVHRHGAGRRDGLHLLRLGPPARRAADACRDRARVDRPARRDHGTVPRRSRRPRAARVLSCDLDRLQAALLQLVDALIYLHGAGKLHCDVKPSNVLVRRDGLVKLLDFGLATEFGPLAIGEGRQLIGTPAYMSPEQAANLPLSAASDWYSVGVMLFEALTGVRPFEGSQSDMIAAKQREDGPAPATIVPGRAAGVERSLRRAAGAPAGAAAWRRRSAGAAEPRVAERRSGAQGAGARAATRCLRRPRRRAAALFRTRATTSRAADASIAAYVHGSSGIGKTALVGRFLDHLREREPDAVVLTGRCYERESVPVQGARQHRRRAEPVSAPDRPRGGCRHAARRGGAGAAVSRAAPGRADRAQPRSQCRDRRLAGAAAPRVRRVPRAVRAPGAAAGRSCCSSTTCTGATPTAPRS